MTLRGHAFFSGALYCSGTTLTHLELRRETEQKRQYSGGSPLGRYLSARIINLGVPETLPDQGIIPGVFVVVYNIPAILVFFRR